MAAAAASVGVGDKERCARCDVEDWDAWFLAKDAARKLSAWSAVTLPNEYQLYGYSANHSLAKSLGFGFGFGLGYRNLGGECHNLHRAHAIAERVPNLPEGFDKVENTMAFYGGLLLAADIPDDIISAQPCHCSRFIEHFQRGNTTKALRAMGERMVSHALAVSDRLPSPMYGDQRRNAIRASFTRILLIEDALRCDHSVAVLIDSFIC
jgi:hypothetical protein